MSIDSLKSLFRWAVPSLFRDAEEDRDFPIMDDPQFFVTPSTHDSSLISYSGSSFEGSSPSEISFSARSSTSSLMSSSTSSEPSSNPQYSPTSVRHYLSRPLSKRSKRPFSDAGEDLEAQTSSHLSKRQRSLFPENAKSSISHIELSSSSTFPLQEHISCSSSLCLDDVVPSSAEPSCDSIELEFPPTPSSIHWTKTEIASGTSPGPRCWSASCVFQQKLLLLGGYDLLTPYPHGLHVYDPASGSWANHALEYPAQLPSRYAHVLANVEGRLIIFGGDSLAGYRNDLFELEPDFSAIRPLQALGTPPGPRAAPGHAVIGSRMFLSGGDSGNDRGYHNDLHVLHLRTLPFPTWEKIVPTTSPHEPRGWHTLSAVKNKLYLFGGYNGNSWFGDMHIFDPSTSEWSTPSVRGKPPSPRHSHAAVVIDDQYIVVVGGVGVGQTNFDSVHIFDTRSLSWIEPFIGGAPLPARHGHSLFHVPELRQIFSFGGYDFTHLYDCFAILPLQHAFKIKPPTCTISSDLSILVNNPSFSDISFKFEDGSVVYAHKALLSARSEYFRAMFSSFAESKQAQISIAEISQPVFLSLLEFLYSGSTAITPENVFPLLLAANMYNLQALSSLCQRTFECALSCQSAISLFEFADSVYAPALKKVVLHFITKNLHVILLSSSFEDSPLSIQTALLDALIQLQQSSPFFDQSSLEFLESVKTTTESRF